MIQSWGQHTTVHVPDMTPCLFLYDLWSQNGFCIFIWLKKLKRKIMWKIIWNRHFSAHTYNFIRTQLCSLIYIWSMVAFILRPYGSQTPNCFLFGSLQEMFPKHFCKKKGHGFGISWIWIWILFVSLLAMLSKMLNTSEFPDHCFWNKKNHISNRECV